MFDDAFYAIGLFCFLVVLLLIIFIPLIGREVSPLFRKKFFWKAVDYSWIALAVVSLVILLQSLRLRELEFRILQRGSVIESTRAFIVFASEGLRSSNVVRRQFGTNENALVCNWAEVQPDTMPDEKLGECEWLSSVFHHTRFTALDVLVRGKERAVFGEPADLYLVAQLHPFSPTTAEEAKAVVRRAYEKEEREQVKALRENLDCRKMVAGYSLSLVPLDSLVFQFCKLATSVLDQRLALDELQEATEHPWVPSSSWPFFLATGLAVRFMRTTAEFLIDYKDGK